MRKTPFFQMTKNGFVFLVMGFTGKKAAQFKEAYISEFDRMEAELAEERYLSIGNSTDKKDLIALVDQLQRTIMKVSLFLLGKLPKNIAFLALVKIASNYWMILCVTQRKMFYTISSPT
ncbi:hypothetical protein AZH52_01600 [Proteus mirabilis]|nr:hypothetical protein AZH52_01600 [Proteus mirabilis]